MSGEAVDHQQSERRRGRTVPAGALVLAVMVAAALGILAVVALAVDDEPGSGAGGELQDARFAAGRFAEEVDQVGDGLERLITEAELDATAEVTDIFVGEIDRGAVEVVVVYDRQLASAAGARDETDRYMQLALLRVDGEWLVDNVIDIATAGAAGANPAAPAAPDGTTTTSGVPSDTSAPAPETTVTSPPG